MYVCVYYIYVYIRYDFTNRCQVLLHYLALPSPSPSDLADTRVVLGTRSLSDDGLGVFCTLAGNRSADPRVRGHYHHQLLAGAHRKICVVYIHVSTDMSQ